MEWKEIKFMRYTTKSADWQLCSKFISFKIKFRRKRIRFLDKKVNYGDFIDKFIFALGDKRWLTTMLILWLNWKIVFERSLIDREIAIFLLCMHKRWLWETLLIIPHLLSMIYELERNLQFARLMFDKRSQVFLISARFSIGSWFLSSKNNCKAIHSGHWTFGWT